MSPSPAQADGWRGEDEPVLLPFAVRRGWAAADASQRCFALLAVLLPLIWLASVPLTPPSLNDPGTRWVAASVAFTLLVVLAGPPACYSAARIVRPDRTATGDGRRTRHQCAAVTSAYGAAAATLLSDKGLALGLGTYLFVLTATSLGPITIVWGVVAAITRGSKSSGRSSPSQ